MSGWPSAPFFVLPADTSGDLGGTPIRRLRKPYRRAPIRSIIYRQLEDDGLVRWVTPHDASSDAEPLEMARALDRRDRAPDGERAIRSARHPRSRSGSSGARIVGPAWSKTRYRGGTARPGRTDSGRSRAHGRACARQRRARHVAFGRGKFFWQALATAERASHRLPCELPRALVPTDRQLSDDMIGAIIDRDGVVGALLYNDFIDATWTTGTRKDVIDPRRCCAPHRAYLRARPGCAACRHRLRPGRRFRRGGDAG